MGPCGVGVITAAVALGLIAKSFHDFHSVEVSELLTQSVPVGEPVSLSSESAQDLVLRLTVQSMDARVARRLEGSRVTWTLQDLASKVTASGDVRLGGSPRLWDLRHWAWELGPVRLFPGRDYVLHAHASDDSGQLAANGARIRLSENPDQTLRRLNVFLGELVESAGLAVLVSIIAVLLMTGGPGSRSGRSPGDGSASAPVAGPGADVQ